jgi:hypothetical protein
MLAMMLCVSGVSQQAQAQQPVSASCNTSSSVAAVSSVDTSILLARMWRGRRAGFSFMPSSRYAKAASVMPMAAPNLQVFGSGTLGRLTKWTGFTSSISVIGNSTIFEDKFGKVGIGTDAPTSRFTVAGIIETTLGGYKFPDGTVQATAAVSGLQTVSHDATLTGDGAVASPLGVSLPLVLKGPTPGCCIEDRVLTVWNTSDGNNGLVVIAGGSPASTRKGGTGVFVFGGTSSTDDGGEGVHSIGGNSASGQGGDGVVVSGGNSDNAQGGIGLRAGGGGSNNGPGGIGVKVFGGSSVEGDGGVGIDVVGGRSADGIDGGVGVKAAGSAGFSGGSGGTGVEAKGGIAFRNDSAVNGSGGNGVVAVGGEPFGGGFGGNGVVATGGNFNGRGVVATGGIGSVGYGVEATGGASTGSGSTAGAGVFARGGPSSGSNSESGFGIIAIPGEPTDGAAIGRAGSFQGDVFIGGLLTAGNLDVQGTKNFKIDHPLDPENKYLLHASIESSEVLNVYSGNVVTNATGEAVVALPDWFEALNRDFRYQLTVIGTFAQAIVANEVRNNRFTIKTNAPNVKVSWQVTGVRSDLAMQKHPFSAVEDKPERERGHYLQPELYNQSEERSVEWARNPRLMKQLKQQRIEALQAEKQPKIGRLIP